MTASGDWDRQTTDIGEQMTIWAHTRRQMQEAAVEAPRPDLEAVDLTERMALYPRWKSGVDGLEMQGFTILGGKYGTGKSILAMGCALTQAHSDVCTLVFDAENGQSLATERIWRWYGEHEFRTRFPRIVGRNFFWIPVRRGHQVRQLVSKAVELYSDIHSGVFLVFDSLTKIARILARDKSKDTFQSLDALAQWCDETTQKTNGNVRVLALSELAKDGTPWGQRVSYDCTMAVTLHKEEERDMEGNVRRDLVRIHIEKDRQGPDGHDLGIYVRRWEQSQFTFYRDKMLV